MPDIHVLKLGGSLLDVTDLTARITAFRSAEIGERAIMVVGGGDVADTVRRFDKQFHLDETTGHWLAVQAMAFNARIVAAVLPACELARDLTECERAWSKAKLAIIEPVAWLRNEEARGITIPHRWVFTSDSIAAHVAKTVHAARLTLLKSTLPAHGGEPMTQCSLAEASKLGIVDGEFAHAAEGLPCVELVNLREPCAAWGRSRCVLR